MGRNYYKQGAGRQGGRDPRRTPTAVQCVDTYIVPVRVPMDTPAVARLIVERLG